MSQVTKPIALDETLQDVVAAIQGITQGGMIVSTGTVGSATQPVYIDGGVPTAMTGALAAVNGGTGDVYGKAPFVYTGKVTDANIAVKGSAEVNRRTIVSLINGDANNHAPTPNNWYILYTSSGSDTGGDYGSQIAVGVNVETIWYRIKHGGTWREWHQIYGITTGTPTDVNTSMSLVNSRVQKSGNVVSVWVELMFTANMTLSESVKVCKLPWVPANYPVRLTRIIGTAVDSDAQEVQYGTLKTDGYIYAGNVSTQSTTNKYVSYYGTYLTND